MWQPIETAPKDGTRILLAGKGFFGPFGPRIGEPWPEVIGIGQWSVWDWESGKGSWMIDGGPVLRTSHWMPLPLPPATEEQIRAIPAGFELLRKTLTASSDAP